MFLELSEVGYGQDHIKKTPLHPARVSQSIQEAVSAAALRAFHRAKSEMNDEDGKCIMENGDEIGKAAEKAIFDALKDIISRP